ncbi:MAG: hypothetical protein JXR78_01475 [Victivallales bacterium]|nr:hypothetical protein [Victivallales bacterium]
MNSIPGYVDLQVNGYKGVDFSSPGLSADAFVMAAEALFDSGTVIFLPTLVTSSLDVYRRNLTLIHAAVSGHGLEAHIPGVHLEGPFISRLPGAVGCHPFEYVLDPDCDVLAEFIDCSGGMLKLLTVAADSPGAGEFIAYATERNIVVSLGHHLANSAQIRTAVDAGAKALTHLGNGLPNELPRHDNPIWNALACRELTPMLIGDGHHLPDNFIRCVAAMKGAENLIIVSDASPAAGLAPGMYEIWGNRAILEPDGRLHNPQKQCLVGSASNMSQCMMYLRGLDIFDDAELDMIGYYNPLKLIGLTK